MKNLETGRCSLASSLVVAVLALSACTSAEQTPEQIAEAAELEAERRSEAKVKKDQVLQDFLGTLSKSVVTAVSDLSFTAVYDCDAPETPFGSCDDMNGEQITALYGYVESKAADAGAEKCSYSSLDYGGTSEVMIFNCHIDDL